MPTKYKIDGKLPDGATKELYNDVLTQLSIATTETTTPPPPSGKEIVVTKANYKTLLTNVPASSITFTEGADYFEMFSPAGHAMPTVLCDYENAYIEAEIFIVSGVSQVQLQLRGGKHSDGAMCDGCAYKGSFTDTITSNRKELFHRESNLPGGNGYCSDRTAGRIAYQALKGRWATIRFEVKNLAAVGGITPAQLQNSVDGKVVQTAIDKGDWNWSGTQQPVCPARQFGNAGPRMTNEILNKAGTWAIFRFDKDTVVRCRKLTVKETAAPAPLPEPTPIPLPEPTPTKFGLIALFRPGTADVRAATKAAYEPVLTKDHIIATYVPSNNYTEVKELAEKSGAAIAIGYNAFNATYDKDPLVKYVIIDIEGEGYPPNSDVAKNKIRDVATKIGTKQFIVDVGSPTNDAGNIAEFCKVCHIIGIQAMGKQDTPTMYKNFITPLIKTARDAFKAAGKPDAPVYAIGSVSFRGKKYTAPYEQNDENREPSHVVECINTIKPLVNGAYFFYGQPADAGDPLIEHMPRLAELMKLLYGQTS